jgi:hypothetical protein
MKSTFSGLTHTTPFPNVLIDEVMPRLKDTQWRILCVVVRQTLGWHDDVSGLRKDRDWLTRSQLKARTGRNSEAIALAIDTLVKQGYITVQDSKGIVLKTPQERRKNHGRIYYGLTEYWRNQIGSKEYRKSEQLPENAGVIFHWHPRKTKHVTAGKPNTTKETETKEKQVDKHSEMAISQEVSLFIKKFQIEAQSYGIEPDVALSSDTQDRLLRWLRKNRKEKRMLTLQKYFCSDWISIVQQNYSLRAFANLCTLLRIDYGQSNAIVSCEQTFSVQPNSL